MRDERACRTGRLPKPSSGVSSTQGKRLFLPYLERLASRVEGHLVLIAGDRVYHPSLHRRAAEWNGERDALALTTGDELVGICALSREVAIELARRCPSAANSIDRDLLAWLG